jgi:hypothetical protein
MGAYNEEGRYRARIAKAEITEAKNDKRTPQVELTLDLIGIYDPKNNNELYECHKGNYPPVIYMSITEATMGTESEPGWVADTLAYLGFDGNFNNIANLAPQEIDVLCQYEDKTVGKGGQREKWSVLRPGGRRAQPLESRDLRGLNAKFSKAAKAATKNKPSNAPSPVPHPAPTPATNGNHVPVGAAQDDIPF